MKLVLIAVVAALAAQAGRSEDFNAQIAAVSERGGTVEVPAGVHEMAGPLVLKSNIRLHLADGARLVFPDDPKLYPMIAVSYEGELRESRHPLVFAEGATNVTISGGGTFEAKRDYWQGECYRRHQPRPKFFHFANCRGVRLEGFRVRGGPNWTIHLLESKDVVVRGLDVLCKGRNTDGIDVDSSEDVLIENCRLDQGDDGFVMKSGKNAEGRRRGKPTRNVTIRNCTVVDAHTLLGIGSELSGGIEDITLENCTVEGEVWRILLVKTNPARGGYARNIRVRNVKAARAKCAIFGIMSDYQWESRDKKLDPEIVRTPIEGITVENVDCGEAWYAYELKGDPELKPRRLTLRDCTVRTPSRGVGCAENVDGLVLERVTAGPGPFLVWCDDPDSLYRCGDEATFTVVSSLTNGIAHVKLDNFGARTLEEFDVDLAARRTFTVKGTRDVPGFLKLTVSCGKERKLWGAAFSPERITSGAECPSDFEAYWRTAIAKYDREVPADVKLEPLPALSTNAHDVSLLSLRDPQGRTVYGFLSVPKDRTRGPFPVRVAIPGAGPSEGLPLLRANEIGLKMNVHYWKPVPGAAKRGPGHTALQKAEDDELQRLYPMKSPRYTNAGIAVSREAYYYYGAILAINRTVNWLKGRPEADAADFTYAGGSQGGGLGLALLALNGGFRKATIGFPALTAHLCDRIDGREAGWPRLVDAQLPENRAAAAANAPYFDGVNFASLVRCPVRFLVGSVDEVAPPHAGFAAYNACPSADKEIRISLGFAHNPSPADRASQVNWLEDK